MKTKPVNILLVEDDEVDIMNVKRAFLKYQITNQLYVANNGDHALQMLQTNNLPNPLVILLDLNMPKMDGIEFLEKLRNDKKLRLLNVVVMSTSSEEKDKCAAYNYNVAGYIVKTFNTEGFYKSIDTVTSYWNTCVYPAS